jgi:hypothetical protein
MPDLLSIGLGGGTLCDPADPDRIGPVSVGFRLTERARVFGGPDMTATDVAVAAGLVELGDSDKVAGRRLRPGGGPAMHAMIADAVDRMKSDAQPAPLIAVGGGARPRHAARPRGGAGRTRRRQRAGAAIAQVRARSTRSSATCRARPPWRARPRTGGGARCAPPPRRR